MEPGKRRLASSDGGDLPEAGTHDSLNGRPNGKPLRNHLERALKRPFGQQVWQPLFHRSGVAAPHHRKAGSRKTREVRTGCRKTCRCRQMTTASEQTEGALSFPLPAPGVIAFPSRLPCTGGARRCEQPLLHASLSTHILADTTSTQILAQPARLSNNAHQHLRKMKKKVKRFLQQDSTGVRHNTERKRRRNRDTSGLESNRLLRSLETAGNEREDAWHRSPARTRGGA